MMFVSMLRLGHMLDENQPVNYHSMNAFKGRTSSRQQTPGNLAFAGFVIGQGVFLRYSPLVQKRKRQN